MSLHNIHVLIPSHLVLSLPPLHAQLLVLGDTLRIFLTFLNLDLFTCFFTLYFLILLLFQTFFKKKKNFRFFLIFGFFFTKTFFLFYIFFSQCFHLFFLFFYPFYLCTFFSNNVLILGYLTFFFD